MDGISKPAQRADAVSALLAAVTLAGGGGPVDKALEAEGVWAELGKEGTPLLSAAATARLPAEEAASAAGVTEHLLLNVRILLASIMHMHTFVLETSTSVLCTSPSVTCTDFSLYPRHGSTASWVANPITAIRG